jgi:hypothetical protein
MHERLGDACPSRRKDNLLLMPPKWVAVVQEIAKAKNVRGEFLGFAPVEPDGGMLVAHATREGDFASDADAEDGSNLQTLFRYTMKPEDSATLS